MNKLLLLPALLMMPLLLQGEEGIPVTDPLVIAKCGSCHARNERGNMLRLSWERATPDAWEEALKRMIRLNGVVLTPPEARSIIQYLSTNHGLAPEEVKALMSFTERRSQEEINIGDDPVRVACAKCHAFERALSWRRSAEDWKQLVNLHVALYPQSEEAFASGGDEAIDYFVKVAPLHSPAWDRWRAQTRAPHLPGRWLVTAYQPGHGKYFGDMQVEQGAGDDLVTQVKLRSMQDGSTVVRSGHSLVYAGYAWRGRSQGGAPAGSAPDDVGSEMREVMWIAPDQSTATGRWYWGPYQEFGLDVKLWRATGGPALIGVDRSSLKTGTQANRVRLIGDRFPTKASPSDLNFGAGVIVRRIVSSTAVDIVAEVDVASNAVPGKHDIAFRSSVLPGAIAVYDRVDYIKVKPESAIAQLGNRTNPAGDQQFEAIGYQRGAEGKKPHTADDVELGPVDVTWSLDAFQWSPDGAKAIVGALSPTGLFTPATNGPNNNYDVWVVAEATSDKDPNGKPLAAKSYLVVSVPAYTLDGRQYVRELGRWVQDGAR